MIADRYYYSRLSERERKAYRVLYDGVMKFDKKIILDGIFLSFDEINNVFRAITLDNPFIYYLNQTLLEIYGTDAEDSQLLKPQYFCSREDVQTYNDRIGKIINKLIADLKLNSLSESEKVRKVHDYFCCNIAYDHDAAAIKVQDIHNVAQLNSVVSAHSVIGVFAKQKAVCEGICKAFKLILNAVGVKCIVVMGQSVPCSSPRGSPAGGSAGASSGKAEDHSWNIVKINGAAYHMDVTWDADSTIDGHICYDNYCMTDEEAQKSHSGFSGVPECSSTAEDFYKNSKLEFYSRDQLFSYIRQGISSGQSYYCFRYKGPEEIYSLVSDVATYFYTVYPDEKTRKTSQVTLNEARRICRFYIRRG